MGGGGRVQLRLGFGAYLSVLYLRKCHDKTAPHAVHVGQKVAISLLRERLTHVHPSGVCAAGWGKRVKSPPAALPHPL